MSTAPASNQNRSFGLLDWVLLIGTGSMWGAGFLFVRLGLVDLDPRTIVWGRLLLGAIIVTLMPRAWQTLKHRRDWWLVVLLALVWMALPFMLIAFAQLTIDSALAGMINGIAPLVTALVAALVFRIRPSKTLAAGLTIGFLGIIIVLLPSLNGSASVGGILMMLLASTFYGIAFNVTGVLQQRGNGALAVVWRALLVATAVTTPLGILGLGNSSLTWGGIGAVTGLGVLSTGAAFITFQLLVGRVGSSRASIATYLTPVVAMLLGVIVVAEHLHPVSIGGMVLVLLGAYLASKGRKVPGSSD
ncbi:DMT family transporter [Gulosibacter chungangensis]|uniref:DMT family transporter n=1 Tax=Gulosibacter chungangensis TaxID=979746 RepID=A0A7J5B7F8_9MICO|nr:DMT family transporter [Gulosibacter chungangensis]KAB1640566.1 DMT family transporter [Gulosibacter chungangensis]